jgi:hypothetical protein
MRRATFLLATLIALAALGCGGGGGSDEPSPPDTAQEKAVAKTYSDYIAALKKGDGEAACALLTPAFQRRAGAAVAVGTRRNLKGAACVKAIDQGTLAAIQKVVPNLSNVEVKGDRASGLDPGEGLIGPQDVFFERIGGEWKISRTVFFR